jgi:bile acid:Na+ symporter, BASS family
MYALLPVIEKVSMFTFLVSSMLAIGLTLSPAAILAPLRDARLVLGILILNFVVAPALAYLVTIVVPISRGHGIGLILLGGAAGAPFFPKLVERARGDLALSAAVLGLLTVGTILFLPFALPLMVQGLEANAWSIARPLVLFILLPLIAGICLKGVAGQFAARVAPAMAVVGTVSLLVVFAFLIILNASELLSVIGSGAILAALLYFVGVFVISWLFGGKRPERRGVLSLATASRNFGAALVPASSSFDDPQVSVMVIVSGIVCLIVTAGASSFVRRRVDASRG